MDIYRGSHCLNEKKTGRLASGMTEEKLLYCVKFCDRLALAMWVLSVFCVYIFRHFAQIFLDGYWISAPFLYEFDEKPDGEMVVWCCP